MSGLSHAGIATARTFTIYLLGFVYFSLISPIFKRVA